MDDFESKIDLYAQLVYQTGATSVDSLAAAEAVRSSVWDKAVEACTAEAKACLPFLIEQDGFGDGYRAAIDAVEKALRSLKRLDKTDTDDLCQAKSATQGDTVSAPVEPLQSGAGASPGDIAIDYTNWRGERSMRKIRPMTIWFGSTDWHQDEQWLLSAYDYQKAGRRDFALRDIHEWKIEERGTRDTETAQERGDSLTPQEKGTDNG